MKPCATELATQISRALISASNRTKPTRTWTPSLEQTLHRLGCRDSLTPPLVARVIDPFLLTHHSLALGFFNWASQQPGFSHTSLTYQSVLKSLSFSRQFNAIGTLLKQVRAQKINLSSSVYRSLIASLIIGKKTHNAFLVFSEASSVIPEIGPEVCNSLLAALASDGYLEYAETVFDKMVVKGVSFSTLGFGVFIWRFSRNFEVDRVLSKLDEVRRGNSEINGSIIVVLIVHGLCQALKVSEANWVLDELRIRDCKPDFMAYRIVTEGFRAIGSVVDTEKVLKKKRKLGVAPRAGDYREFIFALVSERRIWEAKELGEVIVGGNFPMEDDVLNVLTGSVSAIDPDSAIVFFKYMVGKERFPTLLTLTNLSRNLCKHGKTDELLEILRLLSLNDYFKDVESYNVMVSFLCKAGRVREAYGVLQEMKKKGFGPDVSSYNSLMEGCCREDLLRPARKLWDEMFARGCGGNLKTYNILIQKFSEIGQVEEAQRLFHHMFEKGVVPDATTYTSLIEGLCRETELEAALNVFNKSVKQDVVLAQTILSTFVLSLCKEGHFITASKLLRDLTCDIGHSDSHIILLKCLADAREFPIAIEHIKWVEKSSPSTLQVIYAELSVSLSSSKSEPILQLLQTLPECLIYPNDVTWKTL
ncbi:pentatricopeptide repeat-containing protein At5g14080 [Juglans microcarpa x Juglans regia]|uniref:pentatricopeptide repeat-containing protein At5g14080 n=1 Tax=Juglans microcarpa x Juglans regia TaxID=2249226 RepID=UPI001B7ED2E8|nr:pentatricopeptide repeat-containing protein At5g14080 [Juglans microcarpa x Juglans regia]